MTTLLILAAIVYLILGAHLSESAIGTYFLANQDIKKKLLMVVAWPIYTIGFYLDAYENENPPKTDETISPDAEEFVFKTEPSPAKKVSKKSNKKSSKKSNKKNIKKKK